MKITTAQEYRDQSHKEEEISIKSLIDEIEDKLKNRNLKMDHFIFLKNGLRVNWGFPDPP